MSKEYNERLGLNFWGLKTKDCLDPIMRIYPMSLFEEEAKKKIFFLTDTCYTLKEFNQEIDLFQNDLKNIRKEAKRKFDLFIKMKGEKNGKI